MGCHSRLRLLSAAEHLFGERSYRRTSVAGICARAGIATGSFYAHYKSKADIFAAVVRRINADLRAAMSTALAEAPDDQRSRERAAFGLGLGDRLCRRGRLQPRRLCLYRGR